MTSPVQVLFIEHNLDDIEQTKSYLNQHASHIELKLATSFSEARDLLSSNPFDSILLDYNLPDGNGLDFLQHLKTSSISGAPIFLVEHGDYALLTRIFDQGACFHVAKGERYWECLPSLIVQAVECSRLAAEEKTRRIELEQVVHTLTARLEVSEKEAGKAKQSAYQPLPQNLTRVRSELMSQISHH